MCISLERSVCDDDQLAMCEERKPVLHGMARKTVGIYSKFCVCDVPEASAHTCRTARFL